MNPYIGHRISKTFQPYVKDLLKFTTSGTEGSSGLHKGQMVIIDVEHESLDTTYYFEVSDLASFIPVYWLRGNKIKGLGSNLDL